MTRAIFWSATICTWPYAIIRFPENNRQKLFSLVTAAERLPDHSSRRSSCSVHIHIGSSHNFCHNCGHQPPQNGFQFVLKNVHNAFTRVPLLWGHLTSIPVVITSRRFARTMYWLTTTSAVASTNSLEAWGVHSSCEVSSCSHLGRWAPFKRQIQCAFTPDEKRKIGCE